MKRAAIFASAALGVGVGCAFDLPEPKAGGSEIIQPEAGSEGGASSGAATPDGGDPASPCLTQGGWLFCDDFDAKSGLSALWTLGVDLDGDRTSLDKASGRLTAKLPKADPGDKKKARVGTTVDLDEKGLHIELDVFLHNTEPTANYNLLEATFDQAAGIDTESLSVYDDESYAALSVKKPTYDSLKGPPLPKKSWLHLVFDLKPNAMDGDAILSYRPRELPNEPLTELVHLKGLRFIVDTAPRKAHVYLGLARYDVVTPEVVVDYDNFAVSKLP